MCQAGDRSTTSSTRCGSLRTRRPPSPGSASRGSSPTRTASASISRTRSMLVTALNPLIGYDKAAEVAKKAYTGGKHAPRGGGRTRLSHRRAVRRGRPSRVDDPSLRRTRTARGTRAEWTRTWPTIDLTISTVFAGGFPDEVFAKLRLEPASLVAASDRAHPRRGRLLGPEPDTPTSLRRQPTPSASPPSVAPGAEGGGTIIQDLPYGFASGVLLNMMDDPRHQRIRRLVTPSVTPRALAADGGRAARAAPSGSSTRSPSKGSCEFLSEVAVELPIQAVAALMGVPEHDRHDLHGLVEHHARLRGSRARRDQRGGGSRRRARWPPTGPSLIAERRQSPGRRHHLGAGPGPSSRSDGARRPMSELELLMFFNLLVVAGSETTRNSIALGMVALIEHPDQLEALRDDRSLMPTAVEEILRWTYGDPYNRRTATRDTDDRGSLHRAGRRRSPSGGRRPTATSQVFDDPLRFDIRRDAQPASEPSAIGATICLGANAGPHGDPADPRGASRPARGLRTDRTGGAGAHQQARRGLAGPDVLTGGASSPEERRPGPGPGTGDSRPAQGPRPGIAYTPGTIDPSARDAGRSRLQPREHHDHPARRADHRPDRRHLLRR